MMKKNVFRIKKRKKTSSKSNQDETFDRFDKGNRTDHGTDRHLLRRSSLMHKHVT